MLPFSIARQAVIWGCACKRHGRCTVKRRAGDAERPTGRGIDVLADSSEIIACIVFADSTARASQTPWIKVREHRGRAELSNGACLADGLCSGDGKEGRASPRHGSIAGPGLMHREGRRFRLCRGAAECDGDCSARDAQFSDECAFTKDAATSSRVNDNDCRACVAPRERMIQPSQRKTRRTNPFLKQPDGLGGLNGRTTSPPK